jgi:hypothetical protein
MSRTALTSLLIAVATLVLIGAIVAPPYFRARSERRKSEAFAARVQPVLDALIEAERAYKERQGKFWRDQHDALSPEATKQALGVDLGNAPGYHFAVYPADLEADPTLRVAAKGTGENEGLLVECVYDAIQHTKSCKLT